MTAILQPLADASDNLDDEETQKLPIRLQYYEGEREPSTQIRQKLVEALYQVGFFPYCRSDRRLFKMRPPSPGEHVGSVSTDVA